MFSRITPKKKSSSSQKEEAVYDSPLDELSKRLDRLELILASAKETYIESIQPRSNAPQPSRRTALVNSLKRLGRRSQPEDQDVQDSTQSSNPSTWTPPSENSSNASQSNGGNLRKEADAKFIPMADYFFTRHHF